MAGAQPALQVDPAAAGWIDRINALAGALLAWGILALVLLQIALVVSHYVFRVSSVPLTELLLYINAYVFLGAAGHALALDEHVRVDILYRAATPRAKAEVDLLGTLLFLVPMLALLWWKGGGYVAASWAMHETSMESSGLPVVYILKSAILLFAMTLSLQAIAIVLRCWRTLSRPTGPQDA
jgi:TRAP-type mannitol/chloroaromatic compound transport system permease small subunit